MPQQTQSFALIYLAGMLLMSVISPVVSIIMQYATIEGLKKFIAWKNTTKVTPEHDTNENTTPNTNLP